MLAKYADRQKKNVGKADSNNTDIFLTEEDLQYTWRQINQGG